MLKSIAPFCGHGLNCTVSHSILLSFLFLSFPPIFFSVLVLILLADTVCGTRKIPSLISENFFNLRQYNYITQANSNICFGSSRVDILYSRKKKLYMYLPISKTWNQVIWEKIMGKYFSLCFCNYFMVFFSVNPTAYTYFVAKCQILTRQRWMGKNTISDLRGRKCDKYLNTEHLLLSCWSLVCSLWKQRSNNYFAFILNIWSC